jgi:hypothetical protein
VRAGLEGVKIHLLLRLLRQVIVHRVFPRIGLAVGHFGCGMKILQAISITGKGTGTQSESKIINENHKGASSLSLGSGFSCRGREGHCGVWLEFRQK